MRRARVLPIAVVAAVLGAGGATANAATAEPFGQHVAMCAHELGQPTSPPSVTCTHDGMTMTFPNFGAMVQHMRQMH